MVPWSYHCAVIMPLLCHVPLWCHTAVMPLSHFVPWCHCATVVSLCHGRIIVPCPIAVPWCHHATTAPLLCHSHITVPGFLCAKASLCRDNATAVPLCHESAIAVPCPVVVPQCHDANATLCAMVSLCHDSAIAVPYPTAMSQCHCHTLCHGHITVPFGVTDTTATRRHQHSMHAPPPPLVSHRPRAAVPSQLSVVPWLCSLPRCPTQTRGRATGWPRWRITAPRAATATNGCRWCGCRSAERSAGMESGAAGSTEPPRRPEERRGIFLSNRREERGAPGAAVGAAVGLSPGQPWGAQVPFWGSRWGVPRECPRSASVPLVMEEDGFG